MTRIERLSFLLVHQPQNANDYAEAAKATAIYLRARTHLLDVVRAAHALHTLINPVAGSPEEKVMAPIVAALQALDRALAKEGIEP